MTKIIEKIMKKFIYTAFFLLGAISLFAQNTDDVEEVEVKGKVLYVDQVNSLKPPLPILDVPQSVSVITDEEIKNQGCREIGDIMQSIQGMRLVDSTNTYSNTKAGMFNSTLLQHDILNKSVSKYIYDYETGFDSQNATNQDSGGFGMMATDIKVDGKNKIWQFPDSRILVHPSGSTDLHHEGSSSDPEYVYTHNNAELWMQESLSRELEREYFTVELELFGDTDIMIGQIINLTIQFISIWFKVYIYRNCCNSRFMYLN